MQNDEDARRLATDLKFLEQLLKDAPDDPAGPEITLLHQEIESPNPEGSQKEKEESFTKATKDALTLKMLKIGVMHSDNDPFVNHVTDLKAKSNRAIKFKEDLVNGAIKMLQEGLVLSWNVEERIPFTDKDLAYFYKKTLETYEDGSQKKEEMKILTDMIRLENDKKNNEFEKRNDEFKDYLHNHGQMLIESSTTPENQKDRLRKMAEDIPSFIAQNNDPKLAPSFL